MSNEHFVVAIPRIVLILGIICDAMSVAVMLGFTLFSKESPHIIFYIIFGLLFWLGSYLALKTLRFKVVIEEVNITVYSIFMKPYTFTFQDIVSAVRQISRDQMKSERVVIKTCSGKRLVVESMMTSYDQFFKRIQLEVQEKHLSGFD